MDLGRGRSLDSQDISAVLNHRRMHAITDPQEWDLVFPGVTDRVHLAFQPALSEPTRNQDAIDAAKHCRRISFSQILRLYSSESHARSVVNPTMGQRLVDRLVGISELDVFADHCDLDLRLGRAQRLDHLDPAIHVARSRLTTEMLEDLAIHLLLPEHQW